MFMISMTEGFRSLAEDILSFARGRQQFMADVKSRVADLAAGTRRYLHDCDTRQRALKNEVQHAACELRQKLADGDSARLEAFCQMHNRVAGRVAGLARDVRCKLGATHNDSVAAWAVWNELASARSGARKATRKR
jgi:hypothetical protein